jgi:hypothetical protein
MKIFSELQNVTVTGDQLHMLVSLGQEGSPPEQVVVMLNAPAVRAVLTQLAYMSPELLRAALDMQLVQRIAAEVRERIRDGEATAGDAAQAAL